MRRPITKFALIGVCAGLVVSPSALFGGDNKSTVDGKSPPVTTATPEEEPKNWIELAFGGNIIDGDEAQFKQEHRLSGDVFGGIQDLHLEHQVGEKGQLVIDGHAIFDNNDFGVKIDLSQPDLGYIRGGVSTFRNWYDGNGGWFPHRAVFFEPPIPEMHIDRGEAWVELGLRIKDWPEITLHYSHLWRQGEKDSTIWGDTTLTGLATNPARKIAPAYRDIDETRDIFALDIMKPIGDTAVTLGMRYEHNENDNKLQLERGAGQLPPTVAAPGAQRFITQHETNDLDIFNGHIFTETHIKEWMWFTTGYSFSSLGSDITGTRIIGTHYNSMFGEPILTLQGNDHQILNLAGTQDVTEHIFNANLLFIPAKDLTVLSGFRYTREDKESDSMFLDFNTTGNTAPFTPTNPRGGFHITGPFPRFGDTSTELNNLSERLEVRYTGVEHWLFYVEGEWEEEFGNVREHVVANGVDQGELDKDTSLLGQKYTIGANWYPMARLAVSAQYYYKIADYDNDFNSELAVAPVAGSERNQRLLGQDWNMQDANVRITLRPKIPELLGNLSFVTRYDFVQQYVDGKWAISPTQTGNQPVNVILDEQHSGLVVSHMIGQSVNWNPCARLYLQANVSYVLSETNTPADYNLITVGGTATGPKYTSPTVPDFRNDYWIITGGAGYVIDDKTDLHLDYYFYRSSDWLKDPVISGMPYGMGATEHNASISLTRQISKNMRLLVKYTYFNYADETFGGHNNYRAHSIYSGLQIRF